MKQATLRTILRALGTGGIVYGTVTPEQILQAVSIIAGLVLFFIKDYALENKKK